MQQAATEEVCVWCGQNSAVQRSAPVNSELQSPVADAVAIAGCPSRSEARSWPRNRRESDECRLKLRSAAMKATQRRHDLGQSIWLDNSTRDMLTNGTLKHRAVSDRADSEPDDPRPRNQEQRFLRCRDPREAQGRQGPAANRRRIPEEISVGANPLSASQRNLLHKGDPE